MGLKVLTWNVNRAGESRTEVWKILEHEDADIVLLQEVTRIPLRILDHYQCLSITPRYFEGHNAPFSTTVLSTGEIDTTPYLMSELDWINKIHSEQYGWIVECATDLGTEERFRVISVHSPAFPVPRDLWKDVDVSDVKLTNNPDIWFTEILYALLLNANINADENWIVVGDFNTSVKFDFPKDRGNREFIGRLKVLGLTDCLSNFHNGYVPTFQHSSKVVEHQLDYCFVNAPMLKCLKQARVLGQEDVFGRNQRLSDHLPVVCEFV